MEVSILQHSKDTSPQSVTISQVAEMIRSDSWPPGYRPQLLVQGTFEGGTRQKDIIRLSGLSVAIFNQVTVDDTPGYTVIVRIDEEMKARDNMMAMKARNGKT